MMELRYQLTDADLRDGLRSHFADRFTRGAVRRVAILAGCIALLVIGINVAFSDTHALPRTLESPFGTLAMVSFLGLLLLVGLSYWFVIPRSATKQFSQLKSFQREKTLRVETNGLRFRDDFENTLVPWSDVSKWSESDKAFLIYLSDKHMAMVPKRAFRTAHQAIEFRDLLNATITSKQ